MMSLYLWKPPLNTDMAIPQLTPNKGNGSVIDDLISNVHQNLYGTDKFQENLDRTEKAVLDNILYYPSDLFRTPEYRFGMRIDIYDSSGDAMSEDRKRRLQSLGTADLIVEAFEETKAAYQQVKEDTQSGVNATASAIRAGVSTAAFAGSGALGTFGTAAKTLIDFGTVVEQPYDPESRDSLVEAILGVKGPQNKVASIYLYLPGNLSFSSDFDYEDADMKGVEKIHDIKRLFGFGSAEGAVELAKKSGIGLVTEHLGEELGGKEFLGNWIKFQKREVENPFLVHMFKGVQRRSFSFDWEMVPRSEEEAINMYTIIHTLRRYAHPQRNPAGRYLEFPSEVNLTFLYKAEDMKEAIAIPKIKKCAIKNIKVDYGENIFAAHKKLSNGLIVPTKAKLSLQLSELAILSREEIEVGF